jgi:hypothetical protein
MRRKRLLVGAGVALAAGVLGGVAGWHHVLSLRIVRGQAIDEEHFDSIRGGMSQAEVEAILGGAPGDFTTQPMRFDDLARKTGTRPGGRWERWAGNHGQIQVWFDEDGETHVRCFTAGAPAAAGWLVQARYWLRGVWP